jgi:hypothetical protein
MAKTWTSAVISRGSSFVVILCVVLFFDNKKKAVSWIYLFMFRMQLYVCCDLRLHLLQGI